MTNKFYRKDATINIYVVNLEEYDKCNLEEDYTPCNSTEGWVSLPINNDDWEDFLKTIGSPEKIAIHDFEDNLGLKGLKIGKYMSKEELNELCERIERVDLYLCGIDTLNALYEALGNFEEALECFESDDYVYYGKMTMEEVAQDYKAIASNIGYDSYYETDYGVIAIF